MCISWGMWMQLCSFREYLHLVIADWGKSGHCQVCGELVRRQGAQTISGGKVSSLELLAKNVFHWAVLAPPLWNLFCRRRESGFPKKWFRSNDFADDVNRWRAYNSARLSFVTDFHYDILNDLHATQRELHAWGAQIESSSMHPRNPCTFCIEDFRMVRI